MRILTFQHPSPPHSIHHDIHPLPLVPLMFWILTLSGCPCGPVCPDETLVFIFHSRSSRQAPVALARFPPERVGHGKPFCFLFHSSLSHRILAEVNHNYFSCAKINRGFLVRYVSLRQQIGSSLKSSFFIVPHKKRISGVLFASQPPANL